MQCDICNAYGDVFSLGCFSHETCQECWKRYCVADIDNIFNCPICFPRRNLLVLKSESDCRPRPNTVALLTENEKETRDSLETRTYSRGDANEMSRYLGRVGIGNGLNSTRDESDDDLRENNKETERGLEAMKALRQHTKVESHQRSKFIHRIDQATGKVVPYFPYEPKLKDRQSPVHFQERQFLQLTPINFNKIDGENVESTIQHAINRRNIADSVYSANVSFTFKPDDVYDEKQSGSSKMEGKSRGEAGQAFSGQFGFLDYDAISISSNDSKMLAEYGLFSDEERGRLSKSPVDTAELRRATNPTPPNEEESLHGAGCLCRLDSISSQELLRDTDTGVYKSIKDTDVRKVSDDSAAYDEDETVAGSMLSSSSHLLPINGQANQDEISERQLSPLIAAFERTVSIASRADRPSCNRVERKASCIDDVHLEAYVRKWSIEGPNVSEEDMFHGFIGQAATSEEKEYDEFWDN